jgi:hypothetical protein
MELIKYARKGNILNIKENYTYKFKQLKELKEQKSRKENDNQKSMFDIALRLKEMRGLGDGRCRVQLRLQKCSTMFNLLVFFIA